MSSMEEIKVESRESANGGGVGKTREEQWPEAQDYDVRFLKERDEDLNTTLIVAGLLSIAISAFIIHTNPQLQPDPNEESVALLHILLFKLDNTIFGGDVPQVPHWTGPTCTIVVTQALLYLSLVATFASALSATLAKQLLDLYAFAGSPDSSIERGRNSQRGLRSFSLSLRIVLLALSSLLQFALLLFSCALSVYLWEVNTVIAAIILVAALCTIPLYSPFGVGVLAGLGSPYVRHRQGD